MKTFVLFFFSLMSLSMLQSSSYSLSEYQGGKPGEVQILRDLVGKVITDPSENSYFPDSWSWTIKSGEIRYLSFEHETSNYDYYIALMTIHLKRREMPVDVKVVLQYKLTRGAWRFDQLKVQSITFPKQTNYASYVEIYMDYDFMPSLVVKNNSKMTLFVAGAYTTKGTYKRFCTELEPNKTSTIGIGPAPDKYEIHFAYKE